MIWWGETAKKKKKKKKTVNVNVFEAIVLNSFWLMENQRNSKKNDDVEEGERKKMLIRHYDVI